MYEKVVSYFESNLCIENIYFRRKHKLWTIGIVIVGLMELIINYIITKSITILWIRTAIILVIDFFITGLFLIFAYFLPIKKIYKDKVRGKTKLDVVGFLMEEERLSAYREIEIEAMDNFLRKKCKIRNIGSIDTVIDMINEEIKDKYSKKNFIEKYFNNTILPILILVLTMYFTNTKEENLLNIVEITVISIISILITGKFIMKIKNINITPVNKKENLLELKRILMDIKIKMESK